LISRRKADIPERLTSNYKKLSEINLQLDLVNRQIYQNQSLNSTLQDLLRGLEMLMILKPLHAPFVAKLIHPTLNSLNE